MYYKNFIISAPYHSRENPVPNLQHSVISFLLYNNVSIQSNIEQFMKSYSNYMDLKRALKKFRGKSRKNREKLYFH